MLPKSPRRAKPSLRGHPPHPAPLPQGARGPTKAERRGSRPTAPLRRVVDFFIDDDAKRVGVLSCGHKFFDKPSNSKKLGGRKACQLCLAAGDIKPLPQDSGVVIRDRFCKRCGCRLRSGQKRDSCDPCRKMGCL